MQNNVGLDDGLAPDQRQAMTQRNCVIYTFLVMNILSYPSGLGYLDYHEFLIIQFLVQCVIFCTTISVFCEIYTLPMRVVAHAAIV